MAELELDQGPDQEIPADYAASLEAYEYFVYLLSSLALLGNSLVVVSSVLVIRSGREPVAAYMCLGNIATADMINSIAVLFGLVQFKSMRHKYLCAGQIGSIVSGSLTSMLSICLIAVERFLFLFHGLKYDSYLTPARTGLLICLLWTTGLCSGLVPVLVEAHGTPGEYVEVCEFIRSPLSVLATAAALAVPALILTPLLYTAIFCRLKRLARRMSDTAEIPPMKLRSVLVVFLSSVAFLLCWGPYISASLAYKLVCEPRGLQCRPLELAIVSPLACLGFANSLLNPVIYAWWHPPYHLALRRVLCPAGARRAKGRASLYEITAPPPVHTIT